VGTRATGKRTCQKNKIERSNPSRGEGVTSQNAAGKQKEEQKGCSPNRPNKWVPEKDTSKNRKKDA